MSGALAIAAVTASIKDLLHNGFLDHDLSSVGSVTITAQPPDRITTGTTEANQLNLFLYQVTPNLGWRNADLPSRDSRGARLSNPPLALDLHYLLTAYGALDMNAEVLLGYAMQVLHENPILMREQLRIALAATPPPSPVDGTIVPGPFGTLSAEDLADQIELIKITPVFLGAEELSKLWTAMQARYRPSMAYTVSVVLIQSLASARQALPVLQRGSGDTGPQARAGAPPVLQAVRNRATPMMPALQLGDDISLIGSALAQSGTLTAVLSNARLHIENELPLQSGDSASELRAHLPSTAEQDAAMNVWATGVYNVAIRLVEPNKPTWTTNSVPVALAPRVSAAPLAVAAATAFDLTVTCTPRLRPLQEEGVRLVVGSTELAPKTIDTPADVTKPSSITFAVPGRDAGEYILRLRVDGIDSLPVLAGGAPQAFGFDPAQKLVIT
jgi:Pvc16 N-terminal domain